MPIKKFSTHGRLNFEIIPFQFSLESADSSIKFWSPLIIFFYDLCRCHFVSCYQISALLVFLHNFVKDNLEIAVVFPLVHWIFFSIMTVHLFWAPPSYSCNVFWTELSGVMAKPCRNQATQQWSCLRWVPIYPWKNEINSNLSPTKWSHLGIKLRSCLIFLFNLIFFKRIKSFKTESN